MKAVASAGYRAIAPDMRGYGRSSAPPDASLYTPLHTAGDLVSLLDALNISSAVIVGHDWGAAHAWNAALMRPDRFKAVFCLSVPYVPRGDVSVFERMRISGGVLWILHEAFIVQLWGRCHHGRSGITSLIT
jgi:pimeloyl-ACP methyl ester carboxylesterase